MNQLQAHQSCNLTNGYYHVRWRIHMSVSSFFLLDAVLLSSTLNQSIYGSDNTTYRKY